MNYPDTLVQSLSKIDKEGVSGLSWNDENRYDCSISNKKRQTKKVGVQCISSIASIQAATPHLCFVRIAQEVWFTVNI